MTEFFFISSSLAGLGLAVATAMGFYGSGYHLMVALFSAVAAVSLHCLVFGIFTGAGKDTRELSEDLSLSREYFERIKYFRRTCFPRALYAILFLMGALFLGGAVTVRPGFPLGLIHGVFACGAVFYNLLVFRFEYRAIRENALLLKEVNRIAAKVVLSSPKVPVLPEIELEPVHPLEWNQHVRALGKFLIFLGINMLLPYIYIHFIMGMISVPFWPFLTLSVLLLVTGIFLKDRYSGESSLQPNH